MPAVPPAAVPPADPTAPAPARVVSLDMLRAVAVLLVIGRHLGAPSAEVAWMQRPLAALVRGGWIGVDLFFVLSGFLISGLLFREHARHGRIRVRRFLVRRGLKIYPPFYAFMAVTVAARLAVGDGLPDARPLLAELLYLQSYVSGLWSHTWSLAVEEHFYLLLPPLLLALSRRRGPGTDAFRGVPAAAALVMAGALALRLALAAGGAPWSPLTHLYATHLRLDGMMFGVLLAWAHHEHADAFHAAVRRAWPILLVVGIVALAPPFLRPVESTPFLRTWGLSLNYVGAGLVMLGVLGWEQRRTRRRGLLAFVGLYSYSIYLWHIPVRVWVMPNLHDLTGVAPGTLASLALFALLSCMAGIAAARLVEFPVLRLRDRFFPSRSGALLPTFAGEGMGPHYPPVAAALERGAELPGP